jgi:hypothetical protein
MLEIEEFHWALGVYVNHGRIFEFCIMVVKVTLATQTNHIVFCTELAEMAIKLHISNKQQQFDILMLKLSSELASFFENHRY